MISSSHGTTGNGWDATMNGAINGAMDGAAVRVLLVDDHQDMLDMMEMMMRSREYHVAKALSGSEALEVASNFAPHIIVSDIGMPGMNGYELMSTLRKMSSLHPFKSIALSGYDAQDEYERAHSAGYDVQLTKPVDFDSLFQTIDDLARAAQ